ncbi:hypothetical protein AB0L75_27000 [Streptomyces sp. NPDC052101]|uniref:hypothetical protein n=1 Tax=Streptomyces sp. NPDC052101 TaxID=3155763 RepID=UPI003422F4BA
MDWQDATVRALRERQEKLPPGWVMYIGVVGTDLLPDDFPADGPQEFDAVAVGPDGSGIVFEVIHQRALNSQVKVARIDRIRKLLHRFKGWDVEVIVLPPAPHLANAAEIKERLQAVSDLLESAESSGSQELLRAAFVLAFSVLEWTLARHLEGDSNLYRMGVRQMAEKMVSEGLISEGIYRDIRELQPIRNGIVHGLSVGAVVDGDTIRHVMQMTQAVNAEISQAQTSANGAE